jgi:hypothetical protein
MVGDTATTHDEYWFSEFSCATKSVKQTLGFRRFKLVVNVVVLDDDDDDEVVDPDESDSDSEGLPQLLLLLLISQCVTYSST